MLPVLERHQVLAPTLLGHARGPPLEREFSDGMLADVIERVIDDASFDTSHSIGNLLGG